MILKDLLNGAWYNKLCKEIQYTIRPHATQDRTTSIFHIFTQKRTMSLYDDVRGAFGKSSKPTRRSGTVERRPPPPVQSGREDRNRGRYDEDRRRDRERGGYVRITRSFELFIVDNRTETTNTIKMLK